MSQPNICVIGAGCSGLAAIKNLTQAGFDNVVCYEQNNQLGGNWVYSPKLSHSSVCETTHIISSKKMSEYPDFPMPDHYPDYPSHEQVLAYFKSYAERFDLESYIQFNSKVKSVIKTENQRWEVTLETGEKVLFDYLIIANGHHSVPNHPQLPGIFTGEYLHSHSYKNNLPFKDKRVLVIGSGNSACDCAVEISRVATYTAISIRSPQYIIPKFFLGKPVDTFNQNLQFIPKPLRNILQKLTLKIQIGNYRDYGLPEPDFAVTKAHPTLNSELLYKIRHGKVSPKRAIETIDGTQVIFKDGKTESFDTIVAATGYKIALPFFDKDFICYEDSETIELYLKMFHPEHDNLIFIGLVQPQGAIWPLSDAQSQLLAKYIKGQWKLPPNIKELARKEAEFTAKEFKKSSRHAVEVHYYPYLKSLKKEIKSI